jgi:plastocyanin
MKGSRRRLSVIASAALTALLVIPTFTGSASAATTYTVQMFVGIPKGFSLRVMAPMTGKAPTVQIHKGDTINLVGGATLLPVGLGPLDWRANYASDVDQPWGPVLTDPDADLTDPFPTVAPLKFGPAFFGISSDDCGGDLASQCVFDGSDSDPVTGPLVGGDREPYDNNMFVRIDANPGETLWATQMFGPSSFKTVLRIQVIPNGDTATTQDQIDSAKTTLRALERDTAAALDAKLRRTSTKHKLPSGVTVWDAFAGYDTQTFTLLQMYPAKLVVHKGDKVRWHFAQDDVDDHSVTFPFSYAAGNNGIGATGVVPVCDPDGDNSDGPDEFTVDFDTFQCPNPGDELELDLQAVFLKKTGDGKYPGGKEHSGIRGGNLPETVFTPPTDGPYDLRFTKAKLKGYRYACAIHGGFMDGFVVVKP